jgi:hypothetical protein
MTITVEQDIERHVMPRNCYGMGAAFRQFSDPGAVAVDRPSPEVRHDWSGRDKKLKSVRDAENPAITWPSVRHAADELECHPQQVRHVCNGICKQVKGRRLEWGPST